MLLKLSLIYSRRSVMYTAKIEAGTSHSHSPASLHDCEALRKSEAPRKSEALKTHPIEVYIIKDLAVCRLFKKGKGKALT